MPADPDWISACRRVVARQRHLFAEQATIAERTVYDGVGEGGDEALVIDRRCEDLVFEELEGIANAGPSFTAIAEERGAVGFGDPASPVRVVIDPIDGSMNARRTLPSHCLSVAVSSGPSMADVEIAFVHDFGAEEEFVAERGAGARLNGKPLRAEGPGRGIEVVGLESAEPGSILAPVEALAGRAKRIRAIGAIAISLCYVAAGRFDGMFSARVCRSVDAAAAQLVVREAGGQVEFSRGSLQETPLDLSARYKVAAGLEPDVLATMREVQNTGDPG